MNKISTDILPKNKKNSQTLQAAIDYVRRRWAVVPIPARQKGPKIPGWQNLRLSEEELPARFANGENVGVLLGEPSGDITDTDLDCQEAVTISEYFLPQTPAIFGRESKRRSHHLFNCTDIKTIQFKDIDKSMIVEIRSTGGQTVLPPSIHPSGEIITWEVEGEPAQVEAANLVQAVSRLATASLLARHWPAKGGRQEAALALAGGLLREGLAEEEAVHFIEAVALGAGDEEGRMRVRTVAGTARKDGSPTTGWRRLSELVGADVVALGRKWLGVNETAPPVQWEPPIAFQDYDLPPFPADILPGWERQYVVAVAEEKQVPADLPGMLTISTNAAAVAKKAEILVRGGWTEPLNTWTLTALPPGNRKSGTFEAVTAPLEEFERQERDRLAPEIEQAKNRRKIAESHLNHLQNEAAKKKGKEAAEALTESNILAAELAAMEIPVFPELIADDISPEAVVKAMADQGGKITIMSPEGDIFDILAGRYSNGNPNLGNFLKGHAGDTIRVKRVGRPPEFVKKPSITMGLSPQPEVLRGLMDKPGFRGRGLLGRFLYSLPVSPLGSRKIKPSSVPVTIREKYRENVLRLLNMPPGTNEQGQPSAHIMRFSPAAEAVFNEFEAWLEPQLAPSGDLGNMTDWAGKLAGVVARITGVLHLVEHVEEAAPWSIAIAPGTVGNVIRLAKEYLIPHAKAAYAMMGADPSIEAAKHTWEVIQGKGRQKFSKQEAWQWTKGRFEKVEPLNEALKILVDRNYLREISPPNRDGSGRKAAPSYDVNPLTTSYNSYNPYNSIEGGNYRDSRDSRMQGSPIENEAESEKFTWEGEFNELPV